MSSVKKSTSLVNEEPAGHRTSLEHVESRKSPLDRVISFVRRIRSKFTAVQTESPHRSFRRTRRRDYARPLELPGYVAFTADVWRVLWEYKSTFGPLVLVYSIASGLLVGMASQQTYSQLSDLMQTTSGDLFEGGVGRISEAGLLLLTGLSGGFNPTLGEAQQLLAGLLVFMAWLTTVWLLRAYIAGQKPKLRDGLYNAGAPIIPSLLLGLLFIVQMIPVGLVALGIVAATSTGLIESGVEAMLFWVVAMLLVILSLYWITSTLIAMVIVTLPGMYPMRALKTARELVLGRRSRLLLRIVWLVLVMLLFTAIIMIPIILIDARLKEYFPTISWVPVVPVGLLFVSSASTVWGASYIYLLYRKVVEYDTESNG